MTGLLDTLIRLAQRYERPIAIAGALWFALSCASAAGFIDLPQIALLTDRYALLVAGAWNAAWWGFAHPALERRREAIAAEGEPEPEPEPDSD